MYSVLEQARLDDVAAIQTEIMKNGPVTCGVHAEALTNYSSGIVTQNPSGSTQDDHALELVGWGTEGGVDYWVGQNNWGSFWGEDGYFRIVRGQNLAGIETGCDGATPALWHGPKPAPPHPSPPQPPPPPPSAACSRALGNACGSVKCADKGGGSTCKACIDSHKEAFKAGSCTWQQEKQFCCAPLEPTATPCDGVLPAGHVAVPCVAIPACASGLMATVSNFTVMARSGGAATDGSKAEATHAQLCHTKQGIQLHWQLADQHIVADNCGPGRNTTCSHCFDQVWQGDAAEFYMSDNLADTGQTVSEIDVSPVPGGLWAAHIDNPTGYFPLSHAQIPCAEVAVSKRSFPGGWNASLAIPWKVLTSKAAVPRAWRMNFYRMDYGAAAGRGPRLGDKHALNASAWAVTSCDGQQQCNVEHIPKYFGVAVLV